jgi:HK97 family phage major capsid protein
MSRIEEIEARKVELRDEVEAAETTEQVEELNKEVDALNEEAEQIAEQEKNEVVAEELEEKSYAAKELEKVEVKSMKENMKEFRNSEKYINAFAEYVKGNNEEMRALLSENAGTIEGSSSTVAVPDFVYDIVKTAWEKDDIMSLVRKVSVQGNLKVNFEAEAGDAVEHAEGSGAVTEENLVLGIVTLTPVSIKKWISISDEVYDLRGEEFLRYVYDELTYKIVKKTADSLIAKIAALPQSLTANADGIYDKVSANKITEAPAMGTIFNAIANLSDEAGDYTIVMNKLTYAEFKRVQLDNNYAADIFDGVRVRFNNTLPAYGTAAAGAVYAIVGDFDHGTLANYPSGDGVDIKFDDKTLMTSDLIRILGRQYVGVDAVADKAFTLIAKPQSI